MSQAYAFLGSLLQPSRLLYKRKPYIPHLKKINIVHLCVNNILSTSIFNTIKINRVQFGSLNE